MITARPNDTSSMSERGAMDATQAPQHMATRPPSARLELMDSETPMGWIDGMAIGFHGFADENEAAHAAWLAYRTMSRRFAHVSGHRPVPVGSEPLSLIRNGDAELILAASRPIAALVRPGADSRSGPDAFGFELQMPVPTDELTVRSTARLLYRTLRRSGIRWSIWAPAPEPSPAHPATGAGRAGLARELSRHGASRAHAAHVRDDSTGVLGTLLVILAMIAIVILPAITTSIVIPLLGGAAGLIALAALASLVHLVATDLRDSLRDRPRSTASHGGGRLRGPTEVAA